MTGLDITFESILSLISLFVGGGGLGIFFTWRYLGRKEKAAAMTAEAEAEKAKVEVEKEKVEVEVAKQDYYQQLAKDLAEDREDRKRQNDELREERDHYKNERNELRDVVKRLEEEMQNIRKEQLERDIETDKKIAKLGRKVESMLPFLCGDTACKNRQRMVVCENGDIKKTT